MLVTATEPCASRTATAATSRPAIPSSPRSATTRLDTARCSTARSSRSTSTAGRASSCCNAACTCATPRALRVLVHEVPVAFMIFDLLWLDGELLTDLPYTERRGALEALGSGRTRWQMPPASTEHGDAALATSRELGLEGIVAKRLDSRYESGRRSSSWRKIKHDLRQEFVIGGWSPGEGWRSGGIGALLLGYYETDGTLHYAGKVGTGFSERELERLDALLAPIEHGPRARSRGRVSRATHISSNRRFVAEVRFTEWTDAGRIRQPAYLGLRDDKVAREVVREG